MVNQSKTNDPRFWKKWRENGAIGDIHGPAVGVAYAFFDSNASMPDIERLAVNEARRVLHRGDHGELEVSLAEAKNIRESQDTELYDFIQNNEIYSTFPSSCRDQMKDARPIKMTDLRYVLVAARHGKTDKRAADFLGNVMNDVYQKYEAGKPFNVAVVYRNPEDGYLDFKRD